MYDETSAVWGESIMSVMYFLVFASLLVAVGFLIAFLWAVKSGQFEDKYTPKIRMLFEENKKTADKDMDLSKKEEK
jgi:cbb3-type cytochrome oxidase maturation protein